MPIGQVLRDPTQFGAHPDRWSVGGFSSLSYGGGTAFVSAANPASEVIDGTGVTLGSNSYRGTPVIATGAVTALDAGIYMVFLCLADFSCGTASGNVQFTLTYAPDGTTFAAFGTTDATGGGGRMQAIRLALTTKESILLFKPQRLVGGGRVRCEIISAAGDAITVTEGSLSIAKLSDLDPPTPGVA